MAAERSDPTRKQIRGSSLLLAGRFISTGLNFVSQILIVRHLSTTEYGAWTYALALVAFFQGISTLGLRRGITRFALFTTKMMSSTNSSAPFLWFSGPSLLWQC